jgi:YaiO family outer membrane protein
MFGFLLLLSLFGVPQTVPSGQNPTHVDAAALVRDGQYDAALAAFQRIAANDPRDHDARVWIGRLHGLMGHPERAEPVYRSVLLEDPASFEAMLGLGTTLVALERLDEGIALLEQAEIRQPQNAELLDALGRAYRQTGRTTRALLYGERAVAITASDSARQALEQARFAHGHRLEIASFGERYNTAATDTGNVDLRVNFRLSEKLRVAARGQHQAKFGFSEQRGGGGVEWLWRPQTRLSAQALAGPRGNDVLPRVDVGGEVAHAAGAAEWTAGYRFVDFPSAQVSVISPGVTWWPTGRTSVAARYFLSLTEIPTRSSRQEGHTVALRGTHRLAPRMWGLIGYTKGATDFDTLSPDQAGDFQAHAVSGGMRFDLPSLTSFVGSYEHQWRRNSIRMHRVSLSLQQRF